MGSDRTIRAIMSWLMLVSWNSSIMRYLKDVLSLTPRSLYSSANASMKLIPNVSLSSDMQVLT